MILPFENSSEIRKIIVCSGPPFEQTSDASLAALINSYQGTKLVCGGTTAKIIARELKRDITVHMKRDISGLPPTSSIEGIDLVTEGVLTLSKAKRALENLKTGESLATEGTDFIVAGMLLAHDKIDFIVGTGVKPVHQNSNVPVELEVRRLLIKRLAEILQTKFKKEVTIQYI